MTFAPAGKHIDGTSQFEKKTPDLDSNLGLYGGSSAGAQLQVPDQRCRHRAPTPGAPPSCWDLVWKGLGWG